MYEIKLIDHFLFPRQFTFTYNGTIFMEPKFVNLKSAQELDNTNIKK